MDSLRRAVRSACSSGESHSGGGADFSTEVVTASVSSPFSSLPSSSSSSSNVGGKAFQ